MTAHIPSRCLFVALCLGSGWCERCYVRLAQYAAQVLLHSPASPSEPPKLPFGPLPALLADILFWP